MHATPSRRGQVAVSALTLGLAACGSVQGTGGERTPDPTQVVSRILDPHAAYRDMGFMAPGPPLPFVATIRFLAGPHPDSTIAIIGVSLSNSALSFRRSEGVFEAAYNVAATFRHGRQVVKSLSSDQRVRVASFSETQRSDESVVFQQFVLLSPGSFRATVRVRDRHSAATSSDESELGVPQLGVTTAFSSLIPIFWGEPRSSRSTFPNLLVNPRATVPYGIDTMRFYLESYRLPGGTEIAFEVLEGNGNGVWRDLVQLNGAPASAIVAISPGALPIGELRIRAVPLDRRDTVEAPLLIGFSDEWVVTNFEDVLSLLRHFGHESTIQAMKRAPPADRAALWRVFWGETDPNPTTPEHEGLIEYFRRLEVANDRYRESGSPGWLTDRGEVFVTLGGPDEVVDHSAGLQGELRVIRWTYLMDGLILEFVDEGFGQFRLTPSGRSDYLRVLHRRRSR